MNRITLLTTLLLVAVVAIPSVASAAAPHSTLARPTLDLDWRSSATTEDEGTGQEAEALRRQKLGRLEVGIGAGLAVGGILAITFVGIDTTVTNNDCATWLQSHPAGYYCMYVDSPQFPAGVISAVLGGLMIAGGTVMIVGGVIRLVRVQKARDVKQEASRHWGWQWGPPSAPTRAPAISGSRSL
jgi:hypothetical protein